MLTTLLVIAACIYAVSLRADRIHAGRVTEPGSMSATVTLGSGSVTLYRGHDIFYYVKRFKERTRQYQQARADLKRVWRPTVDYSLRLASAATGVSLAQLRSVSYCESHFYPFARNGQYRGLFQEGPMFERHPIGQAGFNVFDPLPNALVAALTVSREGWGQWECR